MDDLPPAPTKVQLAFSSFVHFLRFLLRQSHVRCRIIGPSLPHEYFNQERAIAWHGDTVYLRIGDDVYEGQQTKKSCEGANIHFYVDMHSAAVSLDHFAVTDSEFVFWPAGTIRKAVDLDASNSELKDAFREVADVLGIEGHGC